MTEYQEKWGANSPALGALKQFVNESREIETESFEDFERELHDRVAALERELVEQELERWDVSRDRIQFAGKAYRRGPRAERPYLCQAGEIRVMRQTYVPCDGVGRAVCPTEYRAGIIGRFWTPSAARIAATGVALMTPKECAGLFAEQGGMQPSTSSLDRLPKILSKEWERNRPEFETMLRCSEELVEEAVSLVVSIDGVQALMKDEARAEKRSQEDKRPMGPAGFREVGCATLSLLGVEGENLQTN